MCRWPTSTECPGEPAMEISSRRGSQFFKMMTGYTFKIRKYKNVVDNNNLVYHMFIHCCVIWTPAPRAYPRAGRSRAARRRTGRATASAAATAGTICHRGTRLGTGEENICWRFSKNILPIPLRSLPDIPLEKGVRDSDFIFTGNCRMAPIWQVEFKY